MPKWHIKYLENDDNSCPVQDWMDELPKPQLKAMAKKLILLEKCGNDLRMPHSKSLKQGLFELRELSYGLRIYYCFAGKKIVILLHSSGKTGQTKNINYARGLILRIKKEIENHET
jgi:putative addiction module killer protein